MGVSDLLFQRGGEIVHALGELHFDLMELFLEPMLQPVKTLIHRVETLIHRVETPLNPPKILLQKRAKILAKRYDVSFCSWTVFSHGFFHYAMPSKSTRSMKPITAISMGDCMRPTLLMAA